MGRDHAAFESTHTEKPAWSVKIRADRVPYGLRFLHLLDHRTA
jgi:hypothetical protein